MILITLVSVTAFAGTEAKVIAVINKADWCPVCQKNGMRAMAAFKSNNKDMAILFVANDLTNNESTTKSAEELKKFGLDKVIENYTGTGVVHFLNLETKAQISQISLAKTDQELAAAMKSAEKSIK